MTFAGAGLTARIEKAELLFLFICDAGGFGDVGDGGDGDGTGAHDDAASPQNSAPRCRLR